jgi:uncharacterized protein
MTREVLPIGTILWQDLTVDNAEELRDFYSAVVGWQARQFDMEGYTDYEMISPTTGDSVVGICHARGDNADIPPQWLIYFNVANVEQSIAQCLQLGGQLLVGPKPMGNRRFCVIRDPSGAVCALNGPK